MKKLMLSVVVGLQFLAPAIASADSAIPLPNSYESVLQKNMDSPISMVYSADMAYRSGDYPKALKWNLAAAKQMFKPAIENTKFMIQKNMGVAENRSEVVDFLTYYGTPIGDSLGDMFAQLYLADYYSGHNCVWQEFSAETRNLEERCLGVDEQLEPMSEDQAIKAHYWFKKASEQGNQRAMYTMGMMDVLGLGVGRNIPKGMADLKQVADSGHAPSAFILAQIHNTGYWVPQDPEAAFPYLKMAANAQLAQAQLVLAQNYLTMRGVDAETQKEGVLQAIHWFTKVTNSLLASDEEIAQAHFHLGEIYSEQRDYLDALEATLHYEKSISAFDKTPNKWSLKALMDIAQYSVEADDLTAALNSYLRIETLMTELPTEEQKEFDSALRQAATIYARGTLGMEPDQFKYSEYMKKYHALRASEVINNQAKDELFGFNAYAF